MRWSEELPGCTFSRADDGMYRYGLWSGDVGIILAVDARELQIIPGFGFRVSGVGSNRHVRAVFQPGFEE